MSYLGRQMLGGRILLGVRCQGPTGVPLVPDQAPVALVYSSSGLVASLRLPIRDRQDLDGWFQTSLLLDSRFSTGLYRVVYQYTISGVAGGDTDTFEVVPGGQADGAGLALVYYSRPASDFCLLQSDSGRLIRKRNPRL